MIGSTMTRFDSFINPKLLSTTVQYRTKIMVILQLLNLPITYESKRYRPLQDLASKGVNILSACLIRQKSKDSEQEEKRALISWDFPIVDHAGHLPSRQVYYYSCLATKTSKRSSLAFKDGAQNPFEDDPELKRLLSRFNGWRFSFLTKF
jgi:hypothetical protein